MTKPVILAVDDDSESLGLLERELRDRYGDHYKILSQSSPRTALSVLERLRSAGADVAVLLADQWINEMTGVEFLSEAVRAENSIRSCRTLVLMDQATENIPPNHRSRRSVAGVRRDLGTGACMSSERWGR